MGRAVLSVIVGYAVIFFVVFGALTAAYLSLGTDRAFKPASYEPSTIWLGVMFIVGLLAAIFGGVATAIIARSATPPRVLAAVVIVLGLLFALPTLRSRPPAEPRPANVGNLDAMAKAHTPPWVAFANPLVGAAGVLVGAAMVRRPSGRHDAPRTMPG